MWKGLNQICLKNFIPDYFSVDWEDFLKIDELNADISTKIILDCLVVRYLCWKMNFTLTTKNIEIYSPLLWKKEYRLIMTNILKEIGIILRSHGKESNSLILVKL